MGAWLTRTAYSSAAWDLAFRHVRAEIRRRPNGSLRPDLWIDGLLNDGGDEDGSSVTGQSAVISFASARQELVRDLVALIEGHHRVWKRYPVLPILAKANVDPEAIGQAYLLHLRRHLETSSEPRTGSKQAGGSVITLSVVQGHSEGP